MKKINYLKRTRVIAVGMGLGSIGASLSKAYSGSSNNGLEVTLFIFLSIIFFQWAYISHLRINLIKKENNNKVASGNR